MSQHLPFIAIDAMGGDHGPSEALAGLQLALQENPQLCPARVYGTEQALASLMEAISFPAGKVTHHFASQIVEMSDKPLQAYRSKKDSSMAQAINAVHSGEAGAVVSSGNTGCLMANGTLRLKTMSGIARPALASVIPNRNSHFILIDAGANPQSTPENLLDNAILGSHFCRTALGIEKPRVGLLTIGTEEGKGNDLTTTAHRMIREAGKGIHYHGLIEGFQVFEDEIDVVVCDGFVGNILLKSCEGLYGMLKDFLKKELTANPLRATGAFLAQGAFKAMKTQFNPDRYGGAPLLGLRGNILKAHGSSSRHAWKSAILTASNMVQKKMIEGIRQDLEQIKSGMEVEGIQAPEEKAGNA